MQQINFYSLLAKPSKLAVDFNKLWKTLLWVVIILAAVSISQYFYRAYAKYHLSSLQSQLIAVNKKKQELIDHSSNIKSVRAIEASIAKQSAVIEQKNALKQKISQNSPYNLYPYLRGLALASTAGIWLKEISITNKGKQITLQGGVVDPVIMPKYIQILGQQAVFVDTPFANLKIVHEPDTAYANFTLSSK